MGKGVCSVLVSDWKNKLCTIKCWTESTEYLKNGWDVKCTLFKQNESELVKNEHLVLSVIVSVRCRAIILLKTPSKLKLRFQRCSDFSAPQNNKIQLNKSNISKFLFIWLDHITNLETKNRQENSCNSPFHSAVQD